MRVERMRVERVRVSERHREIEKMTLDVTLEMAGP